MIDAQYRQPTVEQVVRSLSNGKPSNIADFHALLLDHLEDLKPLIASVNVDVFKRFWNRGWLWQGNKAQTRKVAATTWLSF